MKYTTTFKKAVLRKVLPPEKGSFRFSFDDEIFNEAKNALQTKLGKSKFDSFAAMDETNGFQ